MPTIWLAALVLAGCDLFVVRPSTEPAGPAITCLRVPEVTCHEAVALVRATGLGAEVQAASAIIVADSCPPRAVCDRELPIVLAVVIVPADPARDFIAVSVFGTVRPEQVAEWEGPLPEDLAALLRRR